MDRTSRSLRTCEALFDFYAHGPFEHCHRARHLVVGLAESAALWSIQYRVVNVAASHCEQIMQEDCFVRLRDAMHQVCRDFVRYKLRCHSGSDFGTPIVRQRAV